MLTQRFHSTLVELSPNVIDRLLTANFHGIVRWLGADNGSEWVCFGEVARFATAALAQEALNKLSVENISPRCFCALPFDSRKWSENSYWILPEITLVKSAGEWRCIVIKPSGTTHSAHSIIDNFLDRNTFVSPEEKSGSGFSGLIELSPTFDRWKWLIHNVQNEISERRLRKAVLSRREIWRLPYPLPISSLFETMKNRSHDCYRFAVPIGSELLIGASPERLFAIRDRKISVDALAGTRRRGATEAEDRLFADELLSSEKEQEEHRIVVDSLTDSLARICTQVDEIASPTVKKTNHVQHLYTKLSGTLRNEISIDEALQLLHPTPAVGGDPKDNALTFLERYETHNRLFYAGPVGWVDCENAEFAVAIRSAILYDEYAALYAGVGVVAGSNASSEWYETTLKLQPMWNLLFGTAR